MVGGEGRAHLDKEELQGGWVRGARVGGVGDGGAGEGDPGWSWATSRGRGTWIGADVGLARVQRPAPGQEERARPRARAREQLLRRGVNMESAGPDRRKTDTRGSASRWCSSDPPEREGQCKAD